MSLQPFAPATSLVPLTSVGYQQLGGAHDSHTSGWRSVLGGRQSLPAVIACIGDSTAAGFGPGISTWSQSWPAILNFLANERYPTQNLSTHGRGLLLPQLSGGTMTANYITAQTGTADAIPDTGLALNAFEMSTGGGVSWTYSLVGTTAYLFWAYQPGGGSFTWTLDGGSPQTVDTSADGYNDTGFTAVTLDSTPGNPHTLVIAYVADSGPVQFDGLGEANGDETLGLQVYNAAVSGTTAQDWAGYSWQQWTTVATPTLYLVNLGVNDWQTGRSSAQFKADLQTVIANAKSQVDGNARGFILNAIMLDTQVSEAEPWSNFVNAMYAIAAADTSVDVLDWTAGRMPPILAGNQPNEIYDSVSGELTAAGHGMVADFVVTYIGPA